MSDPDLNTPDHEAPVPDKHVIPVMQEFLVADKKTIETGKVLISKHVAEETVSVDAGVTHEQVVVERKPINQYVDSAPPAVRQEGDVTIISVLKEVLVVEKRLMLVEEVHITKQVNHYENIVTESLRKEEVRVSRESSGTDI